MNKNNSTLISETLLATPLFSGLDEEGLAQFIQNARLSDHQKGKILFLQGEKADYFYIIKNGWVKLFRETISGDEHVIDMMTRRHAFGETSVFEEGKYPYRAKVIEDSEIIIIPTAILKKQLERNHKFSLNMLSSMSHYRRHQERQIEHLTIENAPRRIGCFMLRLCFEEEACPVTLTLPYNKSVLALHLGMKAETFSRALAALKENVGIEINGSDVRIKDVEKLKAYCRPSCSDSFPECVMSEQQVTSP